MHTFEVDNKRQRELGYPEVFTATIVTEHGTFQIPEMSQAMVNRLITMISDFGHQHNIAGRVRIRITE